MAQRIELYLSPPKGIDLLNAKELWRFRELFLVLAWRDVAVRYKQTAIGVVWAVLQPVLTMIVFTFIFNRMAHIESGDQTPYPIFLYVGLVLWQYYSITVTNASNSLVVNAPLIQKVYFPRLVVPTAVAATHLVDLAISSTVLACLMVYYRYVPSLAGLAILPLLLFTTICSALGLGLFLCSLNVKYRDVRHALPFFVQILMYVTPVIYPVSMLDRFPAIKTAMLILNPMSGVISNARAGLLCQGELDWRVLLISLFSSCFFFIIGLWYFRRTERYFADIV